MLALLTGAFEMGDPFSCQHVGTTAFAGGLQTLRHRSPLSYNTPPCEAPMSFLISPHHRFTVQCAMLDHSKTRAQLSFSRQKGSVNSVALLLTLFKEAV